MDNFNPNNLTSLLGAILSTTVMVVCIFQFFKHKSWSLWTIVLAATRMCPSLHTPTLLTPPSRVHRPHHHCLLLTSPILPLSIRRQPSQHDNRPNNPSVRHLPPLPPPHRLNHTNKQRQHPPTLGLPTTHLHLPLHHGNLGSRALPPRHLLDGGLPIPHSHPRNLRRHRAPRTPRASDMAASIGLHDSTRFSKRLRCRSHCFSMVCLVMAS